MNEQLLRELAEKLGTTAEHLWSVLVYQATIVAIERILFAVFTGLLVYLTIRYWRWVGISDFSSDQEDAAKIGGGFGTFVVAVFVIVAVFMLFGLPTLLFNPEYWALDQVLDAIKPSK